jgi:hypothetical protein
VELHADHNQKVVQQSDESAFSDQQCQPTPGIFVDQLPGYLDTGKSAETRISRWVDHKLPAKRET